MNSETRTVLGWLLAGLIGLPALCALLASVWLIADNLRVLAGYRESVGEVARIEVDRSGARFLVHRIEVRFRPCPEPATAAEPGLPFARLPAWPRFAEHPGSECHPLGETAPRRVEVSTHGPTTLQQGDRVRVRWRPEHPRDVRVAAFSTFWAAPFTLALLGALPGGYALRIALDLRAEHGRMRQR